MPIHKALFFLFVLLSFTAVKAQQVIPFHLTKHNNIILKTLVNNKDSLHLMFQIAMQDASLSPQRTRNAESIMFTNGISSSNSIKIGKNVYNNISFVDNELTGDEADGKIGNGIFRNKAFKIDYDNNRFLVYDDKEPDLTGYKPVALFEQNGSFFIVADNVINDTQQEVYFVLQSGYSGGLLYSDEFSADQKLDQFLKITHEKTLKNSSNQTLTTKQGILPFLKIGDNVLKNVSAGFFTGEIKRQTVNYLGADILKRFIWIFSADRKTVYIKPSKYFNDAYYDMK